MARPKGIALIGKIVITACQCQGVGLRLTWCPCGGRQLEEALVGAFVSLGAIGECAQTPKETQGQTLKHCLLNQRLSIYCLWY